MILPLAFLMAADPSAAFVNKYCVSCHGAKAQMANRRFDGALTARDEADILRRVDSGTMPPKGAPQPGPAERAWRNGVRRRSHCGG
jgi:mono/diheme cytochrome c family protein